ncbi:MAG: prepilin-type N-terminal cleavage/methylation domain-containing protein [Gammaproteobacteria bacterium]|nr:prepilin-type N-terminal cleavage/methylation domain-containing protein [Gammaproteobacteria bacterium]
MTTDCKQSGFSLLEILVAFTIMAISITVLLEIFGRNTQVAFHSDNYSQALVLAESLLDSVGREEELSESGDSGNFDSRFAWNVAVSEYQPVEEDVDFELLPYQLYDVNVTVSWGEGDTQRKVELNTLRIGAKDLFR